MRRKLLGIAALLLAESTFAAELTSFPGAVMPENVRKAISEETPTPTQVLPPVVSPEKPKATPFGAQAEKITFKLNGVILEGNTIYSTAQLEKIYRDKMHQTISVGKLFSITQDITNFYRNNGFILSRAILPPQHVKGGVVRIQIIEGYIDHVDVSGKPGKAKCLVLGFGQKIKQCRPLQISRMEKYLVLANEIPGTNVRAVLSPSKTESGAADVTLVTENHPVTGYFSYDDYGTRYIGPQQMMANVGFNSLLTSGDALQYTITKTPKGGELSYNDVNYNGAIDSNGTRGLIGATRVHTHPLFVLQPTQVDGINANFYTTIFYPLIRSRSSSLTLRTGFNATDSWVTALDAPLYSDHLRNIDIGATYNFADRWYGSNMLNGDFRQGLPIWGYTSNSSVTAQTSRPGANGVYSKIAAQVSRVQIIKGPWTLYGIFQGQWAFGPVLASEQFTFGGSQVGRGYDVAELIGDRGVSASLELRYDLALEKLFIQNLQFYTFYDAGIVWNYKFVGGTPRKSSGTSTGIGVRFYLTKYVSGNFMWTQTLTKQVAAEELIGDGRRPREFFSIVANFN